MTNDHVFAQGGVAYHGVLRFNTNSLPKGAVINAAELLLERDPILSELTRDDSISNQPSVHAKLDTGKTAYEFTSAVGSLRSGTNTYSFDIRHQVQIWSLKLWTDKNRYALLLRQPNINEYNMMDLFAFYNHNAANPALRPRIVVKYTLFQSVKQEADPANLSTRREE